MTQLGFRNGPTDFWLPEGLVIRDRVDLESNITLTAISPRLAIRTFEMVVLPTLASLSRILCRGV